MTAKGSCCFDSDEVRHTMARLCTGFFSDGCCGPPCMPVSPEEMPSSFRRLLVHNDHMTTTLAAYHEQPVELRVLDRREEGDVYRRMITLHAGPSGHTVEFGVVRIEMRHTPPAVRDEILERRAPLGEILIRHQVLRRIEPRWYLRLPSSCPFASRLDAVADKMFYGRVGAIHCDGRPAIELLEVVTDLKAPLPVSAEGAG